jgi:hypothetical protein
METMTHHPRAEKRSPFRLHRGLAAPELFLDTMLTEEHGRHARLTMEALCSIYGNGSRHVTRRVKLTETLMVEQLPEHGLACGSEPA